MALIAAAIWLIFTAAVVFGFGIFVIAEEDVARGLCVILWSVITLIAVYVLLWYVPWAV